MELPVGFGLKLVAEEPAVLLTELGGLGDHPSALARLGRHDDLGAEHAHNLATLDGERLGHRDDALVPALRAEHRDRNARVARRRLDDRVARLEEALCLGVLDDPQREAVLRRVRA
jgi:hypothetical protein